MMTLVEKVLANGYVNNKTVLDAHRRNGTATSSVRRRSAVPSVLSGRRAGIPSSPRANGISVIDKLQSFPTAATAHTSHVTSRCIAKTLSLAILVRAWSIVMDPMP
jgi:hypothetical protein